MPPLDGHYLAFRTTSKRTASLYSGLHEYVMLISLCQPPTRQWVIGLRPTEALHAVACVGYDFDVVIADNQNETTLLKKFTDNINVKRYVQILFKVLFMHEDEASQAVAALSLLPQFLCYRRCNIMVYTSPTKVACICN